MSNNKQVIGRILLTAISAITFAVIFINLFCSMDFQFKGFQFEIFAKVSRSGCTRIEIPPMGNISALTHRLPLEIAIKLNNIDLNTVKELIEESPDKEQLQEEMVPGIYKAALHIAIKLILLAAVGGLFGVFIVNKQLSRLHLYGMICSTVLFTIFITMVFYTYNPQSFYAPRFKGILESAPWMVSSAEKRIADLQAFKTQITTITDNINDLSNRLDNIQPLDNTSRGLRILHVSDIHNNPAAFDFIFKTSDAFDVDLVIDTGDICDLGIPLETVLLERLKHIEIPYLFVPGNHETPQILTALKNNKQIKVVDGFYNYEIKGITITGIADPVSADTKVNLMDDYDWNEYFKTIGFNNDIDSGSTPDIIAVHNPDAIKHIGKKAPVILTGHTHKTSIVEQEGSVIICAGTSGGAGLRNLQSADDIPYTAVLLHFSDKGEQQLRLVAADTLQISNISGELNLQRNVFP